MKGETLAEQLFFLTVRIVVEKKGQPPGVGTGFIMHYEWGDNKEGYFLITNKHVIEKAYKGSFFFIKKEKNQPVLGDSYNITINNFEDRWYKNKDDEIDIAIMPLASIQKELKEKGWNIYFKSISKNICLDDEKLKNLDAIENITFVGYPNGIFDQKNHLPIIRTGTTATPLVVNYENKPKFLIDASVFPGSSGSPVFIFNKGSYSTRKGDFFSGDRIIFLGIISDVFIRSEKGKIELVDIPTINTPIAKTQQMIDIGIVYKASAVLDTIKQLLIQRREIPTLNTFRE